MRHNLCRSFHPWCPGVKNRCLFFMEWKKKRFRGWIYHFSISLTLAVLQRQKAYRILAVLPTIQDDGSLAHMQPGVHTMSDELILQISCNIFLAFKWILMMTSGQNISHYTTAKLWLMCEIMTWSDDKTKSIHKNISTRLRLRALEKT